VYVIEKAPPEPEASEIRHMRPQNEDNQDHIERNNRYPSPESDRHIGFEQKPSPA
jgi:hypothetical protein